METMIILRQKLGNPVSVLGAWLPSRVRRHVVAGMATMPSRSATFPMAFSSIVGQVDRLYLYLDGHSEVPAVARNDPRVIPIFSRDEPGLAGNGKFLGLIREQQPCFYIGVDDDIIYPRNYVARLAAALAAHGSRAVVGVHGATLNRPLCSYLRDRKVLHFSNELESAQAVDVLGTGTIMFDTAILKFDARRWSQLGMADLRMAIEAWKIGLPMICVARPKGFLLPLEEGQSDSIFAASKRNDSGKTSLALELQALRAEREPWQRAPVVEIFASQGVVDGYRHDRLEHRNFWRGKNSRNF
jgi:hypothetical protein